MDKHELQKLLNTIMERGNPKYKTPSGAFIELLREYSQAEKISQLSEMMNAYVAEYPEVKVFLAHRLPGILANNYFTVRQDLEYLKFIEWSVDTPDWENGIKENAYNPAALTDEVNSIITKANDYKK